MLCHVDSSRDMWGTSHWKLIKLSFIYLFCGLGSFGVVAIINLPSKFYSDCFPLQLFVRMEKQECLYLLSTVDEGWWGGGTQG